MSPKQHNAKNKNLPWRSKSNFVELYNNRDMTMFEMANKWNCSPHTISVWAEKHGINTVIGGEKTDRRRDDWFVEKYNQGLSGYQIAEKSEISARRVYSILEENDVSIREPIDNIDVELLIEKYEKGDSYRDISKEFGITSGFINTILEDNGVDIRSKDEHFSVKGEEHPAWKDGTVDWYGSKWQDIRKLAIKRDDYKCVECNMTVEEHVDEWGKDIEVHHKKPVREFENIEKAHRLDNLKTLCVSCHRNIEWEECK